MALQRQLESEPRLPQVGDVLVGKYRIEREIARGGMGAVFVASHEVTGGRVAIKCLLTDSSNDAEATHRLLREARAAVRVRHVNVVDVYDVGEHRGSLFLVMQLLEGETLGELIKRRGALGVEEALKILLPTMRGVQAAHRVQVIHRDLKPNNIFLCADEHGGEITPRVLDFGISKVVNAPGDPEQSLTQTGAVVGTPYYMAPEQLKDQPFDQRIDVYALGVILYQALSGRLPFHDTNYNALVVLIATATPTPLSKLRKDLPSGLGDLVAKTMARAPEDRFSSVAELVEAIAPYARRSSRPRATLFGRSSMRALSSVSAAVLVSIVAVWYWSSTRAVTTQATTEQAPATHAKQQASVMPQLHPVVKAPPTAPSPPPTAAAEPTGVLAAPSAPTEPSRAAPAPRTEAASSNGSAPRPNPKRARVTPSSTPKPTPTPAEAAPKPMGGRPVVTITTDEF